MDNNATMFGEFINKLRSFLHTSPHIHIREKNVSGIGDLVDLIDRFIDGRMKYDLEWDDFISWEHENSYIEEIRNRLGTKEPLLFSDKEADRKCYIFFLLEERNKAAALAGLPARNSETVIFKNES